jgi:hypothetical protein
VDRLAPLAGSIWTCIAQQWKSIRLCLPLFCRPRFGERAGFTASPDQTRRSRRSLHGINGIDGPPVEQRRRVDS